MAKFDAGLAVEALEYDFTKFGGSAGEIPEPSTLKVNEFFSTMRGIFRDAKGLISGSEGDAINEEMSDEEVMGALDDVDEKMARSQGYQAQTIEAVAVLCGADRLPNPEWSEGSDEPEYIVEGGAPSVDDLSRLPYRVLSEFNKWLVKEISPKSDQQATASRPQPQDRRPAGSSRRGKR